MEGLKVDEGKKIKHPCLTTLERLVDSLKNKDEVPAVLLMGAGVSVSAGIPAAGDLINKIYQQYPSIKKDVETSAKQLNDYNYVMQQLSPQERIEVITPYMKNPQVNMAHLAIAQLFKEGYFKRILTVNFDPLLIQACALVGMYPLPAIYDVGTAYKIDTDRFVDPCIIYLNGQHTGMVLRNTNTEVADNEHCEKLKSIFNATGFSATWIVAGYSGGCDPILKILAEKETFKRGLYWLFYEDSPSEVVKDRLFNDVKKEARFILNFDADKGFTQICKKIKDFPDFISNPFDYLEKNLEHIKKETMPDEVRVIYEKSYKSILQANDSLSETDKRVMTQSKDLLEGKTISNPEPFVKAMAFFYDGNDLYEKGLFLDAIRKYEQALMIKSDFHEAAYNWGLSLCNEANVIVKTDIERAKELWQLAGEKYQLALKFKSDKYEAVNNWGLALFNEAKLIEKVDIEQAKKLWRLAGEKYQQALMIKSDFHEAAYNWGLVLSYEAKVIAKTDIERAKELWQLAREKYELALSLKPEFYDAAFNFGVNLSNEAKVIVEIDTGRAKELWQLAREKYELALGIKTDFYDAAKNLAATIINLYHLSQDTQDLVFAQEKAQLAENIKAGSGAYNLACTYALQNNSDLAIYWLNIVKQHNNLESQEYIAADKDFDLIRETPAFQQWLQDTFPTTSSQPS